MKKLLFVLLTPVLAAQTQYDLLLQGGRVIDPKNGIDARMDLAIANGKIARVAASIPASEARRVANVSGLLVTPGLIDIHVHVYQRPESKSLDHDSSVQPDAHTFEAA
jgi:dihydroorotase